MSYCLATRDPITVAKFKKTLKESGWTFCGNTGTSPDARTEICDIESVATIDNAKHVIFQAGLGNSNSELNDLCILIPTIDEENDQFIRMFDMKDE